MTRTIRIFCSLLLALAVAVPAAAQPGTLKLPPYTKVVLKNGMTLLLMEQREVPLVSFSTLLKAGSVSDPAGKEGLASMTAALLRKGTEGNEKNDKTNNGDRACIKGKPASVAPFVFMEDIRDDP